MDKTLKSILWILVVLVMLSSLSTGWFFIAKEKLYDEYVNLEELFKNSMERLDRQLASLTKENTELKSKLDVVEGELRSLEARNSDIESEYQTLLRERDDLDKELARVKKGKFFLDKKLKQMESNEFMAGLLKEKIAMDVELKRLKDSLTPREQEIERLKAENMGAAIRLSDLEEENKMLEEKFRDSERVSEILSRDLLTLKGKSEEYRKEYEDIKIEKKMLETRVSDLEGTSQKFARLLAEKEDMQLKLAGLERQMDYKDREIRKLETALDSRPHHTEEFRAEAYHSPSEVDLPPIVLDTKDYWPTSSTTSTTLERINRRTSLKGRVVSVNRDHHFVVIDLGRQNEVGIGTSFDVYRRDVLIGSIEVIQARERIAAADIIETTSGFYIEIDDLIVKR